MNAGDAPPRCEVVVATSNPNKLIEIRAILGDLPLSFSTLAAFPAVRLPEEGSDYEANAVAKARVVATSTGRVALGEDSGLEVDGLGGRPGPHSARFGGPGLSDAARTAALLTAMKDLSAERRAARFVCVAALATPDGRIVTGRGQCPGRIAEAPRGSAGFGYDPVFEVERGRTMAELEPARKNEISHRARALSALRDALTAIAIRGESSG